MSALWELIESHPRRAIALNDGRQWITYGQLCDRPLSTGRDPVDVVGDSSLQSILEILDAWRVNRAVVLLHPRASESDKQSVSSEVRSAALPDACRAIVATSGSTGDRKFVLLSEPGMLASAEASATNLPVGDGDRWWLCMPCAHVGGLAIIVRCLSAGATVRCSQRFSAEAFSEAMRDGITIASLVPTMLRTLIHEANADVLPGALRAILIGGGPCTPALAGSARNAGFPVLLTWGMSEAGSQIATQRLEAARSSAQNDLSTVGTLLPGFDLQSRHGVAFVRGPALTMGYHPPGIAPEAIDADGWLNTRDRLEQQPNGELRILGRGTDLIISGGENVYPAEVESVLEALPFVRAACVVGLPDEKWGECVYSAIQWTDAPREDDALRAVRDQLGPLKCPRGLRTVERLPQNANGKVDRAAVREDCLKG